MNLPKELKMTYHSQQRLEERKDINIKYNTKNLMKSSVKWYNKDDLIQNCALYKHCCYTTRKSNQIGYITDGDIEVIYNKNTKTAITVLEVKDKFKPITQFIKPKILENIKIKKENIKMKKEEQICPDCGRETILISSGMYAGICTKCKTRKSDAKRDKREYIRYLDLPEKERNRIDKISNTKTKTKTETENKQEEIELKVPDNTNYYESKAKQTPVVMRPMQKPVKNISDPLSNFILILKECGCEIPDNNLQEILNVLISTDKLKDLFMTIVKDSNQQAMLDLEQSLNAIERKLQHNWEYNGFQEADDIKFKEFLNWRRVLKGAIFFWKKLYQTNTLIEMQRAWEAYTSDPNDKTLLAGDRMTSIQKRFQITTESISTILNTRKPFTRVFYAKDKDDAYSQFIKWMSDRQLHENKSKTVIVELDNK